MTGFRSQTDERLAARWDGEPWYHNTGYWSSSDECNDLRCVADCKIRFAPRVECIPRRPASCNCGAGRANGGHPTLNHECPRPEFARPPVNRVLADFRENAIEFWKAIGLPVLVEYAADWLLLLDSDPWMADRPIWGDLAGQMTPTEIDHARKVLTHLAALS